MEELYELGYLLRNGSFNVVKLGTETEVNELLKKKKPLKIHKWEIRKYSLK